MDLNMDTFWDDPEQVELRRRFIGSSRCSARRACKMCLPQLWAEKRVVNGWCNGRLEGDSNSIAFQCNNCGYIEATRKRVSRSGSPSQLRAIERIRRFFDNPEIFEVTHPDWNESIAHVHVETGGNVFLNRGGYFSVSPRGVIKCIVAITFSTDSKKTEETYNELLNR